MRRCPIYALYPLSYGFMIVFLRLYGQMMPDSVWFLLVWLALLTMAFCLVIFWLYEADGMTVEDYKRVFWSEKRGVLTPFLVLGALSAVNYILVAVANPHVPGLLQVIASCLQLPIVVLANSLINGQAMYNPRESAVQQTTAWVLITLLFVGAILLLGTGGGQDVTGAELGWFIMYLASTIPLPVMSVVFQGVLTTSAQADMAIYRKPSLLVAMLNFWLLVFLVLFLWIDPLISGYSIRFSTAQSMACVVGRHSELPGYVCGPAFACLTMLTFCVIFNFYAGIKVVSFEDANFAIIIQQLGPVIAAFAFASAPFMGQFYTDDSANWQAYLSFVLALLAFLLYKLFKEHYLPKPDASASFFAAVWLHDRASPGGGAGGGEEEDDDAAAAHEKLLA